jgi:ribosomal 50S subunit-recycling heat shock protein
MRIDLALKHLCLVKSRSSAKSLCDNHKVLVDGNTVRASHRVGAGDRITIHFRARTLTVELLETPRKQLSKSSAVDYYRPVEAPRTEARRDPPGGEGSGGDWRDS